MTAATADVFFRDLAAGFARDVVGMLVPGSNIAEVLAAHGAQLLARVFLRMFESKDDSERREALDGLGRLDPTAARSIAASATRTLNLPPDEQAELDNYVAAVPMTVRRAIQRPDDHGTPTTLLSQLPRNEAEFLKFLPVKSVRFRAGDRLPGGDYELEVLLGQGGFAEVWKAHNVLRSNRPPVAVKYCLDKDLAVSLRREIEVIDRLEAGAVPEGIVRLIDTGYNAEIPYLIYEYVEGGDLTAWMATFEGEPIPESEVLRVLGMTADALAFAHAAGVVHRDLKPSSLLVTRHGRIKISDFGIGAVTAIHEASHTTATTHSGATLLRGAHTPLYFDPILDPTSVDPRVDIYAMGVIAWQLLIGDVTRAMGPAWRAELEQRGVSAGLIHVIGQCVDLPEKRFQTGSELANSFRALPSGEAGPPTAEPPEPQAHDDAPPRNVPPVEQPRRASFRKRVFVTLASAAMIAIAVVVGILTSPGEQSTFDPARETTSGKDAAQTSSTASNTRDLKSEAALAEQAEERITKLVAKAAEQIDLKRVAEPRVSTPAFDRDTVLTAQRLLADLGYDPGPADGDPGARTRSAIREFQDDEGLTINGRASELLIEQLRAAQSEQNAYVSSNLSESETLAASNMIKKMIDQMGRGSTMGTGVSYGPGPMAGTWYDETGFVSQVEQNGDQVYMDTFDYQGQLAIRSSGVYSNGIFEYNWRTAMGLTGTGVGRMEPDGRHMQVTTMSAGTPFSFRLHKDHTPQ